MQNQPKAENPNKTQNLPLATAHAIEIGALRKLERCFQPSNPQKLDTMEDS